MKEIFRIPSTMVQEFSLNRANGYIMENLDTDCQMDKGSDFIPMVKKSMENGMKEYFVFNMTFTYIIGIGDY